MFRNKVHLHFRSSSEFFGHSAEVSFSCKFKPGLLGGGEASAVVYDDYEDDYLDYGDEVGYSFGRDSSEMYTMTVQLKSRPGHPRDLVSHRTESADVALGDELRVQTDFETRSPLSLAIEQCWISQNSKAVDGPSSGEQILIENGCPWPGSNVSIDASSVNPSFAFRVSETHLQLRKMYIFCLIGLCSPDKILAEGNLKLVSELKFLN